MGDFGNLNLPGALGDFRNRFSKMTGDIRLLCLLPTTDFGNRAVHFIYILEC